MVGEEENERVVIEDEGPEAEVQDNRKPHDPFMPSAAEVEEHRLTHMPYRSWCRECVEGKAIGEHRQPRSAHESRIPVIGMDYFFMTTDGLEMRDSLQDYPQTDEGNERLLTARKNGEIVKCLIIRDSHSKCLFAHVVPVKGIDEDQLVVQMAVADIRWLGHTKLILKADNERAIQRLVREALRSLHEVADEDGVTQLGRESPPAYDSKSNGLIEIGVRSLRAQFRTMRSCLQRRLGKLIPVAHPVSAWLLEHCCMLNNALLKTDDGLTPWIRARGRPFNKNLVGFCEQVLWKLPLKGPQHDAAGNMTARWAQGIFLGYSRESNTYIIGVGSVVTTTRAMMRRPIQNRWEADKVGQVVVTPWLKTREAMASEPQVTFRESDEKLDEFPDRPAALPRRFKILRSDLEMVGYSKACEQCNHVLRYGSAKPGLQHTDTCRARVMAEMAKHPKGQSRLAATEDRIDRALAERIEADVGAQASGSNQGGAPRAPDAEHSAMTPMRLPDLPPEDNSSRTAQPQTVPDRSQEMTEETRNDGGQNDVSAQQGDEAMGGEGVIEDVSMDAAFMQDDEVAQLLITQLGGGRSYARERRTAHRRVVSEIFSPPRLTGYLSRFPSKHLAPGVALDLTTIDVVDGLPWDFDIKVKRERARALLREQKPTFLVGSPCCTAWCTWQALNAVKHSREDQLRREQVRSAVHIRFLTELYQEQMDAGRYFVHEHPAYAASWNLAAIQRTLDDPRVQCVRGDQCQFGAEVTIGAKIGLPIKKPSGFMSNSPEVIKKLHKQCRGQGGQCSRTAGGHHAHCEGAIASAAARYPAGLVRAMLKGFESQLRKDGLVHNGIYGIQPKFDEDSILLADASGVRGALAVPADESMPDETPKTTSGMLITGKFKDDLSKQPLVDALVHEARRKELEYFAQKHVWLKVPRQRCFAVTGRPPISVRWVDVNKGDDEAPRYRSRLVARQIRALEGANASSYFAPAPPLEALRTVLSMARTTIGDHKPILDPKHPNRTQISTLDISRAYFNAVKDADDPTFVELPAEDADSGKMVAKLLKHMYGTRAAADGWQEEYSTVMIGLGFSQGRASPCLFAHHERHLYCSVHGDDFTTVGGKQELDWFETQMKEKYELTTGPRLGPGEQDGKEGVILNRIVRWTESAVEYEADPRQAEKLIRECGLEGANSVTTPGLKETGAQATDDCELGKELHTAFRASAARANYLAADRPDAQFAAKEICRWMSKPTVSAWSALKRLVRYLVGLPRLVFKYPDQVVASVDAYADTDWAGCTRTRKSTSGGCVMLGAHALKTWSSTQSSVALSSGEAEFNGVIRAAGIGLGYQSLLEDLGVRVPLRVWTDSTAAIGICSRQGLGKLRHLDTHMLWVQQAVRSRRIDLRKIAGEENPADLFTKHLVSRDKVAQMVRLMGCAYMDGRAASAPQIRKGASGCTTIADADVSLATEGGARMPHLEYSDTAALNEAFPSITVPTDVGDEHEHMWDTWDKIYQRGQEIADAISAKMASQGRRRCEDSPQQPTMAP